MTSKDTIPKIVCMCGRDIGYQISEFLLSRAEEVRFVVNEHDRTGEWYRTPLELDIIGITEDEVALYNPDLIIVAFYDRILPESVFSIPHLGSWNLHLGDTERYRGAYPNIQALRNGDASYAVTLHRIDAGIDSGEILAGNSFPISPVMTGKELYYMMIDQGMKLFLGCYKDLLSGKALRKTRPQNDTEAVTRYRRDLSHEVHPPAEFINSVRALTFPPFPPPYFMVGDRRFIVVEDN